MQRAAKAARFALRSWSIEAFDNFIETHHQLVVQDAQTLIELIHPGF
jgi:hypothetical protein